MERTATPVCVCVLLDWQVDDLKELVGVTEETAGGDSGGDAETMLRFTSLVIELQQKGVPVQGTALKQLRATSAPTARAASSVSIRSLGGGGGATAAGGGAGGEEKQAASSCRIPLSMLNAEDVSRYVPSSARQNKPFFVGLMMDSATTCSFVLAHGIFACLHHFHTSCSNVIPW